MNVGYSQYSKSIQSIHSASQSGHPSSDTPIPNSIAPSVQSKYRRCIWVFLPDYCRYDDFSQKNQIKKHKATYFLIL